MHSKKATERAPQLLLLVEYGLRGNGRRGAALFVSLLARIDLLYGESGNARVTNSARAAIAVLAATRDPHEKELMIVVIIKNVESG